MTHTEGNQPQTELQRRGEYAYTMMKSAFAGGLVLAVVATAALIVTAWF